MIEKIVSVVDLICFILPTVWSSWGEFAPWYQALFTGNAQSLGAYELCSGLTKQEDDLPFNVRYCTLETPAVKAVCNIFQTS